MRSMAAFDDAGGDWISGAEKKLLGDAGRAADAARSAPEGRPCRDAHSAMTESKVDQRVGYTHRYPYQGILPGFDVAWWQSVNAGKPCP